MSWRGAVLSAALASALAARASAQGMKLPEKPTLLPPCAPGAVPLADTAEFMVYVSVRSAPKESEARRVFRETLVQDVASAFVAPPQLSIPILANVALEVGTPPKAFDAGPWVAGEVGFTLQRDGTVADLRVLHESAAPAIQQQLAAAVRARDSARAFFPLPPELGFDTLQIVLRTGSKPEPGTASVPLLRVAMPFPRALTPVLPLQGNPAPRYPVGLRENGIQGEVVLIFIVDETGRAVPNSGYILSATRQEFVSAVAAVLPKQRFQPALANGCALRQLVQQAFRFNVY